ncbi:branched-chain amino acid ABC transporter substrate-binding protein [Paraburkholderia tropica]|uniref:branched-chain amino acid ABC transporter substrate-binding protein n=1 Tax=Paraburkholderia tropica TaxID=92647 RepID=UPI0007EC9605|nr:branched-chain amino acid ABC transporter substrate-binding protein [Paraburkholderia tropica]OBR46300.1 branched chain amino acid ABC transporter substrate-binding protein [Paraburkholderia tropica]
MNVRMTTIAAASALLVLSFGSSVRAAETQTVKIGLGAPLSGPQARYGKDFETGAELAIAEFNATNPQIEGKDVTFALESLDDQADPKTGVIVAQKLVDDGVKGMLGDFNSGVAIPASAIFSRAGIPQISTATAPAYTRQGFKTTFRIMTSDVQLGSVMGSYVVNTLHAKRIAIIDDRTAYGQGLAEQFEGAVKAAGGSVVDHEFTTDHAVDFRAILTSLKGHQPDFIYYAGTDAQSAPLVKQAHDLGIRAQIASGDMSKTDGFIKIAGPAANGVIVSVGGLPTEKMPGGAAFVKNYKAKFGSDPDTIAPFSYDAAMAMMHAMVKANSSDPTTYLPVLQKTAMKGVTSDHLGFDQYGNRSDAFVTVYRCENGKWAPLTVLGEK